MKKIDAPEDPYVSAFKDAMGNAKAPKIIKHAGQVNECTSDGKKFYRQEKIWLKEFGWVKVAPTDNHFIYHDGRHLGWTLLCTCGAPGVIVGYDAYKELGSNEGAMIVCMAMMRESHRHMDGSS